MMYGTKYYCHIQDFSGNTFTVNLKRKEYSGSTYEITAYAINPLTLSYLGGKDGIDNTVHGSDVTFTFYCKEGENYDDILESELRDFQIEILKGSDVFWVGWLQPEFLSRRFAVPSYYITLTATDGLADLKSIEYPAAAANIGFDHYIDIIKFCLNETGLELDIVDQINIKETNTTEPLLKSLYANSKRFISRKNGVTKFSNCYETLSRLLETLNVQLVQSHGKWVLTQKNELTSNRHIYDWNTLSATTVSSFSRVIDITSYQALADSDLLSKISPYKTMEVVFQNRNIGDNLLSNGTFDSGISGWNNGNSPNNHWTFGWNTTEKKMITVNTGSEANVKKYFYSNNFTLAKIGTGSTNTLRVTFDADCFATHIPGPYGDPIRKPEVRVGLKKPDTSILYSSLVDLEFSNKTYSFDFPFSADGSYSLQFWLEPDSFSNYDLIQVMWDNIDAKQIYENGELTFDKFYQGRNANSTAIKIYQKTLYHADVEQSNDLGGLKYNTSTGLTSTWTGHGEKSQFSNYSFDGPGLGEWQEEGTGAFWNYLGGLGDCVYVHGTDSSKRLMQGWFRPGNYKISTCVQNDNDVSAGLNLNGYMKFWKEDRDGNLEEIDNRFFNAGTYSCTTLDLVLDKEHRLGFSCHRNGPGSELEMTVYNFMVTGFTAPDYNVSIQQLYIYNKLSQYARFKDYITLTLKDSCTVFFWNVVKIGSKLYSVAGYNYDFKNNNLQLELVEYINQYIPVIFTSTTMSTVDGE